MPIPYLSENTKIELSINAYDPKQHEFRGTYEDKPVTIDPFILHAVEDDMIDLRGRYTCWGFWYNNCFLPETMSKI